MEGAPNTSTKAVDCEVCELVPVTWKSMLAFPVNPFAGVNETLGAEAVPLIDQVPSPGIVTEVTHPFEVMKQVDAGAPLATGIGELSVV